MVQVLPYVPSQLEQLIPHISNFGAQIGQGIQQNYRNKADKTILEQLQSGQTSPANWPTMWAKLSPEAQKTYEPFLKSHLSQQEDINKENLKRETDSKERGQKYGSVISTGEEMLGLLPDEKETLLPYAPSFRNNAASLEKKEYFDTLGASMVSLFRDLESKGQLPQGLYEKVIENKIPNSNLSIRENKGRIKAAIALAKKYGGKDISQRTEAPEEKKLTQGQSFEKLPDASKYPNAVFANGSKRYKSNGKNWEEI